MRRILTLMILLLPLGTLAAQGTADTPPAAEVSILSPRPVSLLRGAVEITGTVDLPGSVGYFVQLRPLDPATLEPVDGEDALWSPATLPARGTVVDDVLGEWDTTFVADGLYELELIVTLADGETVRSRVSPVRVANAPLLFEGGRFLGRGITVALATPTRPATALPGTAAPRVTAEPAADVVTLTATIQANVRLGDSVTYPALGFVNVGDTLTVLGRSSRSTWLQVRLPNGDRGFISPSTVQINGNINTLPFVDPPPLPFTPTPVPTATPVAVANLVFDGFRLDPSSPVCGETFTVRATVRNAGTGPSGADTVVTLTDVHAASGSQVEDTAGSIPLLNPGASFEVVLQVTVTAFFDEVHRVTLRADSINAVQETNEGDNVLTFDYTLEKGDCG
jgi:hypothetical protein